MKLVAALLLASLPGADHELGALLYEWDGDAADGSYGYSVSNAGDVDTDSFGDIIVGEPGVANGTGRVLIYGGQRGKLVRELTGGAPGDRFGWSVSNAGDVDNDSYDDVVIGAPGAAGGKGAAYVHSGKDGSALYTYEGEAEGDEFGFSVSTAGDGNGDSYADVVIGAPGFDTKKADDAGLAVVYSGKSGEELFRAVGERDGDRFGFSVASAGDTNTDSFSEIVVGAPFAGKKRKSTTGAAYVYYVKKEKLAFEVFGEDDGDQFGFSVHTAGDVNADGASDVVVGTAVSPGYARVFDGRKGKELHTYEGVTEGAFFGASVGGAIDFDSDGFDEVVVGAPADPSARGAPDRAEAAAYVFSGKTREPLFTLRRSTKDDHFAGSVSGAGDVNNDGFGDVVIGDDGHGARKGSIVVHLGKAP